MAGTRQRRKIFVTSRPRQARPEPTPARGPDPYGNPNPEWLRIDWREHLQTIELDTSSLEPHPSSPIDPTRTPVNYVEMGSGEPLVFVHGLSGSWQNWLENIPHFARERRVIAMDLPGFGDSPMPGWEITIEAYGKLVNQLCEALDTGPVDLIGNSMGGFISAEVVVSQPTRVRKLVLVSAAGVSHARMYKRPAETMARMVRAAAPLAFRYRERALRRPGLRRRALANLFYKPLALRQELIKEFLDPGIGAPGFVAALSALSGYDILDRLEEVEIPALIVWGRNDYVVPPRDAFGFAERLRNSRVEIFDHCGHIPQAERPLRFNRTLEEFLAG
jgi:pimeloyl-ACP methyl ester carboxylesterase